MMKRVAFVVAAVLGSGLFATTPSTAQPQIEFGIGPNGRPEVGIRDPERERYERREYWRQRRQDELARAYEEGRRDRWREQQRYGAYGDYGRGCRNITIQEENDWGRTVTRRIRRCD